MKVVTDNIDPLLWTYFWTSTLFYNSIQSSCSLVQCVFALKGQTQTEIESSSQLCLLLTKLKKVTSSTGKTSILAFPFSMVFRTTTVANTIIRINNPDQNTPCPTWLSILFVGMTCLFYSAVLIPSNDIRHPVLFLELFWGWGNQPRNFKFPQNCSAI